MTRLDHLRQEATGSCATLSEGVTYYQLEGPSNGKLLLLMHGATVPCWEFDRLAPQLWRAGYRTLRFDLYGHGLSDRPSGRYTLERFVAQTEQLLQVLEFKSPLETLAHSLGAAIIAALCSRDRSRFSKLTLVAPMRNFIADARWTKLFGMPLVGELMMSAVGMPALIRRRRIRYQRIGQPELTPKFVQHVSHPGSQRALLSMMRHGALSDQSRHYSAIGDRPAIALIWGSDDAIVVREDIEHIRRHLPPHTFHVLPGAEHNLLLTHTHEIADLLTAPTQTRD